MYAKLDGKVINFSKAELFYWYEGRLKIEKHAPDHYQEFLDGSVKTCRTERIVDSLSCTEKQYKKLESFLCVKSVDSAADPSEKQVVFIKLNGVVINFGIIDSHEWFERMSWKCKSDADLLSGLRVTHVLPQFEQLHKDYDECYTTERKSEFACTKRQYIRLNKLLKVENL